MEPDGRVRPPLSIRHSGPTNLLEPVRLSISASEQTLSLRDEKILAVARDVFARRGFRNTDVQEIADKLGIGKGTIYRAFGTKEQLFFAVVDSGMRRLAEQMAATSAACKDSPHALEEALTVFFSFFEENPQFIELLMQERSEFRDRDSHSYVRHWLSNSPHWRAKIKDGIANGRLEKDDPDRIIDALSALCYGTIFVSYFSKKKIDVKQTGKSLAKILHFGILTDSERKKRRP